MLTVSPTDRIFNSCRSQRGKAAFQLSVARVDCGDGILIRLRFALIESTLDRHLKN